MNKPFDKLLRDIRACQLCEDLPFGPRPVVQLHPSAKILIAGQAPGRKVHASGLPFDDASGDRLRDWMGVTREEFYNAKRIAIAPMGFCYPGKGKSGDLPPRALCAQTWRGKILCAMKQLELTIVIGQYARDYHLPDSTGNLTEQIKNQLISLNTSTILLPHPSPRNNIWLKKNPWFGREILPEFKKRVSTILME